MIRRLSAFALLIVAVLTAAPAAGQAPDKVVVAEVAGPLDQRTLDYLADAVRADAQLVVLQIDAPGIASGDPTGLYEAVVSADVPVAVWVGPDGAVAYGGAALLLSLVDVSGAAPGAELGYLEPLVVGDDRRPVDVLSALTEAGLLVDDGVGSNTVPFDATAVVTEDGVESTDARDANDVPVTNDFLLDVVSPSIGQFLAALDGRSVAGVVLETTETVTADDGTEIVVPSVLVEFRKPGLFTRFLRLSIRPEASFFFLVAGLALMAFEFYAAGAGITAAVSVVSLFIGGYGLATLPMNWMAVAAVVVGMLLFTWEFQRNLLGLRSVVGGVLLLVGGLTWTSATPQFAPRWWAVVLVVVGVALFYVFAMGSVVRSRFSTPTLGREYLIGATGTAETGFDPEGTVVIDGARWKARSHRAAGLGPGDAIQVLEVKGLVLEVGPARVSSGESAAGSGPES